jgi:hypothetical protein
MDDAVYWNEKLARLRRHPGRHGLAPHEPLLLLAFCDLVEDGSVFEPKHRAALGHLAGL